MTLQQGLDEQISSVEDSDSEEVNDVVQSTGRQPLASICEEPPNSTEVPHCVGVSMVTVAHMYVFRFVGNQEPRDSTPWSTHT